MDKRTHPPLHEIARLVTLYRARNVKPYMWDSVGDTYHRSIVELTRARHRLLRAAHAIGRELRGHIPTVDELAAGAVAYVLLDDGQPPAVVGRFVIPGYGGEQLEDADPRMALRRALAALPPSTMRPTMDDGADAQSVGTVGNRLNLPRADVAAATRRSRASPTWPTFPIPTLSERPQ